MSDEQDTPVHSKKGTSPAHRLSFQSDSSLKDSDKSCNIYTNGGISLGKLSFFAPGLQALNLCKKQNRRCNQTLNLLFRLNNATPKGKHGTKRSRTQPPSATKQSATGSPTTQWSRLVAEARRFCELLKEKAIQVAKADKSFQRSLALYGFVPYQSEKLYVYTNLPMDLIRLGLFIKNVVTPSKKALTSISDAFKLELVYESYRQNSLLRTPNNAEFTPVYLNGQSLPPLNEPFEKEKVRDAFHTIFFRPLTLVQCDTGFFSKMVLPCPGLMCYINRFANLPYAEWMRCYLSWNRQALDDKAVESARLDPSQPHDIDPLKRAEQFFRSLVPLRAEQLDIYLQQTKTVMKHLNRPVPKLALDAIIRDFVEIIRSRLSKQKIRLLHKLFRIKKKKVLVLLPVKSNRCLSNHRVVYIDLQLPPKSWKPDRNPTMLAPRFYFQNINTFYARKTKLRPLARFTNQQSCFTYRLSKSTESIINNVFLGLALGLSPDELCDTDQMVQNACAHYDRMTKRLSKRPCFNKGMCRKGASTKSKCKKSSSTKTNKVQQATSLKRRRLRGPSCS